MRSPRNGIISNLSPEQLRRRAEEVAQPLPPLLVKAERVATIVAQGFHGRRRAGAGDSFWQYRRYQAGDPVQTIDWRQSAKALSTYVRENEWEAAQNVYLWIDHSPSMYWRSAPDLPTKAERAAVLALALASLLIRGGERIALLGGDRRPTGGRTALTRLALELSHPVGDAELRLEELRRHSRVVLIGDFLDPKDETDHVIRGFSSAGHFGHVVQVRDSAEQLLPFRGRIRFTGLEEEGSTVIGRAEAVREDYENLIRVDQERLYDICRACSWSFSRTRTDRSVEPTLLSLYTLLSQTETVS